MMCCYLNIQFQGQRVKSRPGELAAVGLTGFSENNETLFYAELIVCDLCSFEALSAVFFTCGKLNAICVSHSRYFLKDYLTKHAYF